MGSSSIFGGDGTSQLLQTGIVTSDGQDVTSARRQRNLIRNRSGYRNTNGWTVTGSATITRTTTAGEIVDGVASLRFGAGSATNYASNAFTINNIHKGVPLNISFDFLTQSGTAGDWDVVVFDVTAGAVIAVSAPVLNSQGNMPVGSGSFNAFFVSSTNTSYELRIVRRAGSGTFSVANVDVSQQIVRVGAPIITWQAYTPTFSAPWGTVTVQSFFWRRVGDTVEIQGSFTTGTTTSGVPTISLPDGLTIDFAKVLGLSGVRGLMTSPIGTNPIHTTGTNTGVTTSFVPYSPGYNQPNANTVAGNGAVVTCTFSAPVTQWDANVTMGDRALEEYVWNTSTNDADDTTSFGYGAAGSAIPTIALTATGARIKRVRFQTPIQATDILQIEVQVTTNQWFTVRAPLSVSNNALYGMWLVGVSGSSTDVDVSFGRAGATAFGAATYGATGESWTGVTRYRVRKVSSGAQIGGAISTANIVGRVDGNAPATGMIGEVIESTKTTNTSGSTTLGTFTDTGVSIALTPGIWEVEATTAVSINGIATATSDHGVIAQSQITDASNNVQRSVVGGFGNANSHFVWANHFIKIRIIVTSNTTYKSRFAAIVNNGSPTITACTAQAASGYPLVIRAVRIA